MKKDVVVSLISDYMRDVRIINDLFAKKYQRKDLLRAWREKVIPQYGIIGDNIEYGFHGIGCCVVFPDREVDFDFGPENRIDGFDLWRLTIYLESRKDITTITAKELEEIFNSLIESEVVVRMPDSRLYISKNVGAFDA